MTAATKRRPKKAFRPPPLGKVTWATKNAAGQVVKESSYGSGPALLVTQRLAEKAPDETFFTIERRALFGPAAQLYRVVREEDGAVQTYILSNED